MICIHLHIPCTINCKKIKNKTISPYFPLNTLPQGIMHQLSFITVNSQHLFQIVYRKQDFLTIQNSPGSVCTYFQLCYVLCSLIGLLYFTLISKLAMFRAYVQLSYMSFSFSSAIFVLISCIVYLFPPVFFYLFLVPLHCTVVFSYAIFCA